MPSSDAIITPCSLSEITIWPVMKRDKISLKFETGWANLISTILKSIDVVLGQYVSRFYPPHVGEGGF